MNIEEYIKQIQQKLIEQGFVKKTINYKELQMLHQKYGKEITEKIFAIELLGISLPSYGQVKNQGKKARILKDYKDEYEITQEKKEEIQQRLIQQGFGGKAIDYKELQMLHQEYGKELEEKIFAQEILGISLANYSNVKNQGTRAKILKQSVKGVLGRKIEEIQNILKEQGYSNKLIDYQELQNLYKQYGKQMEEYIFAQKVLMIPYGNYWDVKNNNKRTRILRERGKKDKETIEQKQIEEIQSVLKEHGYVEKAIDYQELQIIHQKYGKELEEKIFAQEILGISLPNFINVKNKGTRAKILKVEKINKEEIEVIQNILREQGYDEILINYQQLHYLHQTFGKQYSEKTFAVQILEISFSNYRKIKNEFARTKILSKKELSLEQIEEIQRVLKEQGYVEKAIDYQELQMLYKNYGQGINEKAFIQEVLGISYDSYYNVKKGKSRAKILKGNENKLNIEDIEKIQIILKEQGYVGKVIDYQELHMLYKNYGMKMDEKTFSLEILELSDSNYYNVKNGTSRVKILKGQVLQLTSEKIENIQKMLKEEGYGVESIDYQELQRLHQKYGKEMSEKLFALEVLEISYNSYTQVKTLKRNARILKKYIQGLSDEIEKELIEHGYGEKIIDYQELQELHEKYGKNTDERIFAKKVLKISNDSYESIKNGKSKVKILKANSEEISFEEIEHIKEKLIDLGYLRKLIDYDELKKLHEDYAKTMKERDFAQKILLLSYNTYRSMISKNTRGRILKSNLKMTLIKEMLLKESRYYLKEEIEQICEENKISINQFVDEILSEHSKYQKDYIDVIHKGKIWIGKTKFSDNFIKRNYSNIRHIAKQAMLGVKKKYEIDYNRDEEDQIQDAMLYLIQMRGDIEKNFDGQTEIINRSIYSVIRKYLQFQILTNLNITAKTLSLQQKYKLQNHDGEELQERISDSKNVEELVLAKIEKEHKTNHLSGVNLTEQCILELRKQIENGKTREEALKTVSDKLGLGKQEMLDTMQNYLVTKGKVKVSRSGKNVSWAEDGER